VASTRRRRVVIRDPEEESSAKTSAETKSEDKGKGIMVEEPKPMKKKEQVEMDEALDYFKGMSYDDIRPIFKDKSNSNIEFLLKSKEQIEEEENRALERINETSAQKAAKRRKLNEEVKELKQHLEIVPNEDDDVYTEALHLLGSAANHKLMLLDTAAERRLMLLSQVKTVNDNYCCCMKK
nr:hypothetical protein [Tanacetum cinerariifolium]